MKNFTKLLAIAVVIFGFSANSFGQATANAKGVIATALTLSIADGTDLNFGTILKTGAGTVSIDATTGTPTPSANVSVAGTSLAEFVVTGTPLDTYTISAIPDCVVGNGTTTDVMQVTGFNTNIGTEIGAGVLNEFGKQTIKVGATLNILVDTPSDTYSSALGAGTKFTVTVNYN